MSRRRWWRLAAASLVVAVVAWSLVGTGVGFGSVIAGRDGAGRILAGLFPPALDRPLLAQVGRASIETLQIAVASLVLGAVLAVPLAGLIAGNVAAPRWLAGAARTTATVLRGVPDLLWALLFVAAVGLGPAAGVYAISLHAAGMLAKLWSEQLEAVDPAPVEALRLTGAPRAAVASLAILPQARTNLLSQLLYQWECNVRASVIVGFVGAGGIGQELGVALRLFRYQELATLIIAVLLIIASQDQLSRWIRAHYGAASRRPDWCG
ncbi:phosphonate ABC transporter, permease protein PhnE [Natronosporangium hydrolyticum]|uniref:Phosphonate ABC transporter, permease protein PhnE n=1 Tax=Natronosporangium hydrolyticum TaxID=2811111 RepID=A0A895YEM1_9ACTN|nr:phosphonate ABC transporter, permease protein PhnE [Natronosporangium hydrolyticum]QSB16304.1 phosphonate ABC transporter, permease protein PhnE [Natronosporangium hydrolyticum]